MVPSLGQSTASSNHSTATVPTAITSQLGTSDDITVSVGVDRAAAHQAADAEMAASVAISRQVSATARETRIIGTYLSDDVTQVEHGATRAPALVNDVSQVSSGNTREHSSSVSGETTTNNGWKNRSETTSETTMNLANDDDHTSDYLQPVVSRSAATPVTPLSPASLTDSAVKLLMTGFHPTQSKQRTPLAYFLDATDARKVNASKYATGAADSN